MLFKRDMAPVIICVAQDLIAEDDYDAIKDAMSRKKIQEVLSIIYENLEKLEAAKSDTRRIAQQSTSTKWYYLTGIGLSIFLGLISYFWLKK